MPSEVRCAMPNEGDAVAKVTVIVPIRGVPGRDVARRLTYAMADPQLKRGEVTFLVVDDGSPPERKKEHERICREHGIDFHYLDTGHLPVNMARARNAGVKRAKTKYIMFMDVDLHPYPGYYGDLLAETGRQGLARHEDDLVMTAVVYLTRDGTERFFKISDERRKALFLEAAEKGDRSLIEKVSTGTSAVLLHRRRYLELGGYDESFEQWGYEDIEYNLRHIHASDRFPLPADFAKEIGRLSDIDVYRGWKSIYRLYGEMTFARKIVLFHLWHDIDRDSTYVRGYERNRQRFVRKLKALASRPRSETVRVPFEDPVFDRYRNSAGGLSLSDRYRNSPLIVWVQPLKRIPLVGGTLLRLKRLWLDRR